MKNIVNKNKELKIVILFAKQENNDDEKKNPWHKLYIYIFFTVVKWNETVVFSFLFSVSKIMFKIFNVKIFRIFSSQKKNHKNTKNQKKKEYSIRSC